MGDELLGTFRVSGVLVTIVRTDHLPVDDDAALGCFRRVDCKIFLRRGLPATLARNVLLHELAHVALFLVGAEIGGEVEEHVCNAFAALMGPLFDGNDALSLLTEWSEP